MNNQQQTKQDMTEVDSLDLRGGVAAGHVSTDLDKLIIEAMRDRSPEFKQGMIEELTGKKAVVQSPIFHKMFVERMYAGLLKDYEDAGYPGLTLNEDELKKVFTGYAAHVLMCKPEQVDAPEKFTEKMVEAVKQGLEIDSGKALAEDEKLEARIVDAYFKGLSISEKAAISVMLTCLCHSGPSIDDVAQEYFRSFTQEVQEAGIRVMDRKETEIDSLEDAGVLLAATLIESKVA